MNNKDKNIVDKFLDGYEQYTNNQPKKVRVYKKPSRFVCIRNFVIGVAILIVLLILGFNLSIQYILFFMGDLIVILFYGINLFTKDGIKLPTYIKVKKDDKNEEGQ